MKAQDTSNTKLETIATKHPALTKWILAANGANPFLQDAGEFGEVNKHLADQPDYWMAGRKAYVTSIADADIPKLASEAGIKSASLKQYMLLASNALVALWAGKLTKGDTLKTAHEKGIVALETSGKDGGAVKGYTGSNRRNGTKAAPNAVKVKEIVSAEIRALADRAKAVTKKTARKDVDAILAELAEYANLAKKD